MTDWLPAISKSQAALAILMLLFAWTLYRAQRYPGDHPYDIRDTMMDAATNKASLNAHILAGLAIVSSWSCIQMVSQGKDPTAFMTIVLGLFVGGRVGAQWISANKGAPSPGSVETTETVERTTKTDVTPAAPTNPLAKKKVPKA